VVRATAGATKGVEDAETAIMLDQQDNRNGEKVALTTWKPERSVVEMLHSFRYCLSDNESSDNEEHSKYEEDDGKDRELDTSSEDIQGGSHIGYDNIWRPYGDSWYRPQKIANAAKDLLTR